MAIRRLLLDYKMGRSIRVSPFRLRYKCKRGTKSSLVAYELPFSLKKVNLFEEKVDPFCENRSPFSLRP